MKQTNQTVNRKRWMRTGAVGVVFLAAVLCFGVQSRREKQTVVLSEPIDRVTYVGTGASAEQFFKRSG